MSIFKIYLKKIPLLYNLLKKIFVSAIYLTTIFYIIFFLIYNYKIFKNNRIFLFWTWSFGHQILSFDGMSRNYYPEKISLIFIPHPRNNFYLHKCFEYSFDTFMFGGRFYNSSHRNGEIAKKLLDIFLNILIYFKSNLKLYSDINQIYKRFSYNYKQKFPVYSYEEKIMKYHINNIWYFDAINEKKGISPNLTQNLKKLIEKKITDKYPNFLDKKFVFLLLRENRSYEAYDYYRRSGPIKNYYKAIKFLSEKGYQIIIAKEKNYIFFDTIDNCLDFNDIDCDKNLLNLYILTQCSLLISQQSGAHILSNSVGIPVIITDAFPFYLGTFSSSDVILFKKILINNKHISLKELILNHPDIIYGKIPTDNSLSLEFNTEEEILNAVKRKNIKKYQFPVNTPIYYTNNYILAD